MTTSARIRPLRPRRRGHVLRAIGPWLFLPTFLVVAHLPAQAAGPVPEPPAAPVLGAAGSVVVLTDPPGVRAWIGDRFLGTTPARADSLPPGRLQVVLAPISPTTRWRRPRLVYADLRVGTPDTLRIDLRGVTGSVAGFDAPVWVRAELGAVRSPLPRLGTVLPIAALGLGATGAWVRHSADAAYRDYLRALDRGRMEDRYRRAHRLDGVSVACWIGAEACLAGAAWVWLRRDGPVPVAASFDDEGAVRLGLRVGGKDPRAPAREGDR